MLKKLFTRFTIIILILSILLLGVEQLILINYPEIISVMFPWLVILFLIVSSTFHYILLKSAVGNPRKFVNVFLLGTTIKLLIYFSCLLLVLFFIDIIAKTYILNFAVLYLIYTIFELYLVINQLKKISSNGMNDKLLDKSEEKNQK